MGSRFSRAAGRVSRPQAKPPVAKPSAPPAVPSKEALSVEVPNKAFVPSHEPLEHRDTAFEAQLHQLGNRIASEDTIFVPGSDPVSAEAKRKQRREARQRMLRGRLTTANFKHILIEQDAPTDLQRDVWIAKTAQKYNVDAELLSQALRFYRFPKLTKRYDGYLVADPWDAHAL